MGFEMSEMTVNGAVFGENGTNQDPIQRRLNGEVLKETEVTILSRG